MSQLLCLDSHLYLYQLLDHEKIPVDDGQKKDKSRRKALPATYEPDKRTAAWLKLKKDYVDGLGDSLDLVPIGAWHGNGRKVEWWSPILLGLWDPDLGKFVAVCKCMSGEPSLLCFELVLTDSRKGLRMLFTKSV